jgi:hypothetical protein
MDSVIAAAARALAAGGPLGALKRVAGDKLNAFDPASGKTLRSIDVAAHAGTAFDGQHLFQLAEE